MQEREPGMFFCWRKQSLDSKLIMSSCSISHFGEIRPKTMYISNNSSSSGLKRYLCKQSWCILCLYNNDFHDVFPFQNEVRAVYIIRIFNVILLSGTCIDIIKIVQVVHTWTMIPNGRQPIQCYCITNLVETLVLPVIDVSFNTLSSTNCLICYQVNPCSIHAAWYALFTMVLKLAILIVLNHEWRWIQEHYTAEWRFNIAWRHPCRESSRNTFLGSDVIMEIKPTK